MPDAAAILRWLDELLREVTALRDEVAASLPAPEAEGNGLDTDGLDLIDTTSASARFALARDTVAKMCREVDGVGVWKGGRWQVRIGALRRHLDRKNHQ